MFTSTQRIKILKWGSAFVLGLSIIPLLWHGIFFIILFRYYIPIAIIIVALYHIYTVIQASDFTNQTIKEVFFSFFPFRK
ncbi:MAG: hypothetical protein ACI9SY_000367 [Candidatus Paceibacteria bacterium]|jgi:hypothetical protein